MTNSLGHEPGTVALAWLLTRPAVTPEAAERFDAEASAYARL